MNLENEDYLIDAVVLATKIVDKVYSKEIDLTTEDGKMAMIFSLSFLLVGVISSDEIRARVNSIVEELALISERDNN